MTESGKLWFFNNAIYCEPSQQYNFEPTFEMKINPKKFAVFYSPLYLKTHDKNHLGKNEKLEDVRLTIAETDEMKDFHQVGTYCTDPKDKIMATLTRNPFVEHYKPFANVAFKFKENNDRSENFSLVPFGSVVRIDTRYGVVLGKIESLTIHLNSNRDITISNLKHEEYLQMISDYEKFWSTRQ